MVQTLLVALQFDDGLEAFKERFFDDDDYDCPDVEVFDRPPMEYMAYAVDGAMRTDAEELAKEPNEQSNDGDTVHRELEQDQIGTEAEEEGVITPESLIELLERILAFHAFYKRGNPYVWDRTEYDRSPIEEQRVKERYVRIQIRELMSMIVNRLPRSCGNGWNLQKLHDLLHVAAEMTEFGSPANWDTGPCEAALKTWAKKPAKTSQKWGHNIFNEQVAKRLHETACFRKGFRHGLGCFEFEIEREPNADGHVVRSYTPNRADITTRDELYDYNPTNDIANGMEITSPDSIVQSLVGNPKYRIDCNCTTGRVSGRWLGENKQQKMLEVHPLIVSYFQEVADRKPHWIPEDESQPLAYGYTEYKREDLLYRAHPNYRSRGPWYDWTMVKYNRDRLFGHEDDSIAIDKHTEYHPQEFPCKILGFFSFPKKPQTAQMLLHRTKDLFRKDGRTMVSRMTESWTLEYARRCSVRNPVDIDGNQLKDGNGNKIPVAHYYQPVMDMVDVNSIGQRVFVLEEDKGIHEERVLHNNNTNLVGQAVRLKTRDIYWPGVFLAGDFGNKFRPKSKFTKIAQPVEGLTNHHICEVDWTNTVALRNYIQQNDDGGSPIWESIDDEDELEHVDNDY